MKLILLKIDFNVVWLKTAISEIYLDVSDVELDNLKSLWIFLNSKRKGCSYVRKKSKWKWAKLLQAMQMSYTA